MLRAHGSLANTDGVRKSCRFQKKCPFSVESEEGGLGEDQPISRGCGSELGKKEGQPDWGQGEPTHEDGSQWRHRSGEC